jgi:hypothetical protein
LNCSTKCFDTLKDSDQSAHPRPYLYVEIVVCFVVFF